MIACDDAITVMTLRVCVCVFVLVFDFVCVCSSAVCMGQSSSHAIYAAAAASRSLCSVIRRIEINPAGRDRRSIDQISSFSQTKQRGVFR